MTFQTTVFQFTGAGIPGDIYSDYPRAAQSYELQSTLASQNIVGYTAFTLVSPATTSSSAVAMAGGTGAFAGFLVNPKVYASFGTIAGGPLAPTLTLPNYVQGELLTKGEIFVFLPAAAAVGDCVLFSQTDGSLTTVIPAGPTPVGHTFAYANVSRYALSGAGIAVIRVDEAAQAPAS